MRLILLYDSHAYYLAHRSEILARAKCRREADPELVRKQRREGMQRWRERNLELSRERGRENYRRWRDSNRDKHRAIKNAQQIVPLGDCCELCGSKSNLMRFLPDSNFPKIAITICRQCRIWVKS
jgi:hypothetical protein